MNENLEFWFVENFETCEVKIFSSPWAARLFFHEGDNSQYYTEPQRFELNV